MNIGDKIIICCYANFEEHELDDHKPTLVFLGENNVIKSVKNAETAMTVAV